MLNLRYCRLKNDNTLYICDADEYDTATETKALKPKYTLRETCDILIYIKKIYRWLQ